MTKPRWPVDDEARQTVVARLKGIVAAPDATNREAISASKAIISADSLNVCEERDGRRLTVSAAAQAVIPEEKLDRLLFGMALKNAGIVAEDDNHFEALWQVWQQRMASATRQL